MNIDHCMYGFHASLLINCYQSFEIIQEVRSLCGMPILWEAGYVTVWKHSRIVGAFLGLGGWGHYNI
jgi:hypothetical protein